MPKEFEEKHFDVRTVNRYLRKGVIKAADLESYRKSLPNEEKNFELTVFDDEEFAAIGDTTPLSDDEIANMAPLNEEDIDKFDFLDDDDAD